MLNSGKREPVWKLWMKGYPFLCVDTSKNGELLVLGTRHGHLVVFQIMKEDMTVVELFNKKISSGAVNTIKFSPDERSIAAGGTSTSVYIYTLKKEENGSNEVWTYHGTCKGHSDHINGLDWTSKTQDNDSYIRSSSSLPEQKLWKVSSCEEVSVESLSEVTWASTNCVMDSTLTGIWKSQQASEGNVTCVDVNPSNSLVAMATSTGSLSLFRYPCNTEGAFSHAYRSHRHTHNLCFTADGKHVLTVGGADGCIMQWKLA